MTTTATLNVAEIILEQLGGQRFIAMTGARDILGSNGSKDFRGRLGSLQFRIGAGAKDRINSIRITLDANDTYTLEAYRIRGTKITPVIDRSGLYAEDLRGAFISATGFDCTL